MLAYWRLAQSLRTVRPHNARSKTLGLQCREVNDERTVADSTFLVKQGILSLSLFLTGESDQKIPVGLYETLLFKLAWVFGIE